MAPRRERSSVSDEWRASCCSHLTFGWLLPLVRLGNSRPLKPEDLGELSTRDHVAPYLERFEAVVRGKGELTPAKFRSAVWAVFSKDEWAAVACKFVGDAFAYLPPLCINWVVEYAEAGPSHEATTQWGMIYVVASVLLVAPAMTGLTYHWFYQVCVCVRGCRCVCGCSLCVCVCVPLF